MSLLQAFSKWFKKSSAEDKAKVPLIAELLGERPRPKKDGGEEKRRESPNVERKSQQVGGSASREANAIESQMVTARSTTNSPTTSELPRSGTGNANTVKAKIGVSSGKRRAAPSTSTPPFTPKYVPVEIPGR